MVWGRYSMSNDGINMYDGLLQTDGISLGKYLTITCSQASQCVRLLFVLTSHDTSLLFTNHTNMCIDKKGSDKHCQSTNIDSL